MYRLIVLDTVRADALELYGGADREVAPNICRLAGEGVVFDRAWATSPWTLPSHAGMFTGRLPHETCGGLVFAAGRFTSHAGGRHCRHRLARGGVCFQYLLLWPPNRGSLAASLTMRITVTPCRSSCGARPWAAHGF